MGTISKNYRRSNTLRVSRFSQSAAAPILLGVLFFFVLCLGAPDSIKGMAMIVAIAALLVTAARFGVLRERIRWPFIALTLYVLMDGISTFYAVSGKFALKEFLKVFLAYGMAVILLSASPKNEGVTGKRIATVLAVCTAIGSLVSIDLISTRWISGAVIFILKQLSGTFDNLNGLLNNTRLSSLFDNSNVFAGFTGLGVLLSLGCADTAATRRERAITLVLLLINSVAFLLAVSIGAMAFIVLAFVAFLLLTGKDKRIGTLLLMLETLILAVVTALVTYKTSFRDWSGLQPIPILCLAVTCAVLCLLDCMTEKLRTALEERVGHVAKKTRVAALIMVLVLVVAYIVAAFNWTGAITLPAGGSVSRPLYLEPGSYTVQAESDGRPLSINAYSQSQAQIKMQARTWICDERIENAVINVPDDSEVVVLSIIAPEGASIIAASCGEQTIALKYRLLPEFLVNRVLGLRVNQNSALRTVYFQDGLKLFLRSPIVGLGMGAFENAIKSVQSFYYETKYAHNHYFQTMLETGLIGLILFIGLLAISAITIWKSRRKHPYAPMLGAALVFMAGQAVHDIVFSAYAYLPLAYGTFAMIDLCCGEEIQKPKLTQTVKTIGIAVTAACTIIYCGFLAGNMIAAKKIQETPTLDTLVEGTRLDRFEWADYALPYVINVTGVEDLTSDVISQADAFAKRLSKVNSNTIPIYLAQYYFASNRAELGIKMVEKYVDYLASDQNAWNMAFSLLQAYAEDSEAFRSGVARIAQKLETWNAENMGHIELNDGAKAFAASYTGG